MDLCHKVPDNSLNLFLVEAANLNNWYRFGLRDDIREFEVDAYIFDSPVIVQVSSNLCLMSSIYRLRGSLS